MRFIFFIKFLGILKYPNLIYAVYWIYCCTVFINVRIGYTEITLININAPNYETCRVHFWAFSSIITEIMQRNIAICAKFNCKLNNSRDKSSNLLNEIIAQL